MTFFMGVSWLPWISSFASLSPSSSWSLMIRLFSSSLNFLALALVTGSTGTWYLALSSLLDTSSSEMVCPWSFSGYHGSDLRENPFDEEGNDAAQRWFKRSNFVEAQIRDVKLSQDFEKISGTFWKPISYQIEEHRKSFPTTYHTRNFD